MKSRSLRLGIVLAAAGLCLQPLTANAEQGDWLLRGGVGVLDPKSDNLTLSPEAEVEVDTGTSFTLESTYMVADHWGVELFVPYPYTHDIDIVGTSAEAGNIAEFDMIPPILSLQYHFNPDGNFRPYIGAGVNYTAFFNEDTNGALAGTQLELDETWGAAGQIGADIGLNENWFLNLVVRYVDINSDAETSDAFGTTTFGELEIDPFIYQAQIGYRFGTPAPVMAAAPVAAPVAAPPPPPPPPPADTDGDGIVDPSDQCADTPRGDRVGPQGCSCDVTRQLQFKVDSSELTDADKAILDEVAGNLTRLKFVSGTVVGHTDSSGSDAYNQALSERRAQAVASYLEGKGIAAGRLKVTGAGESEPVADNTTKDGRAENRRVVLRRTDCEAPN